MKRQTGFTIIELLVVLVIIGIIAAIAIPNLLNAIQRGKQKRTMGEIRTVATASESYSVDHSQYCITSSWTATSAISAYMEPTYLTKIPSKDGWATDLYYGSEVGTEYEIYSYGKGGASGDGGGPDANGATTDFRDNIWFANGSFTQFPDGMQQ